MQSNCRLTIIERTMSKDQYINYLPPVADCTLLLFLTDSGALKEALPVKISLGARNTVFDVLELDKPVKSSSCDRVTVIDKKDEFCKMCKEFEKKMVNNKVTKVPNSQNKTKIRKKRFSRNKTVQSKENIPVVIYNEPYILKQPEANENILINQVFSSTEENLKKTKSFALDYLYH
ncbi:hypothetical protein K1T71_014382 [Dendrolimus kikuchii]|uniref:Uncharacterized protein n=1 Tax=Dendrolimus kikuchii TaxID=765133 RepID=A0ACC1CE62_9NEOP|nr:hypothetical protein K1T71_014382 [Dendrolimus kikuchii]